MCDRAYSERKYIGRDDYGACSVLLIYKTQLDVVVIIIIKLGLNAA